MDNPGPYQIKTDGPHGKNLGDRNRGCLKGYRKHKFEL